MLDWNPRQYLKYKNERTQPSIDLAARIEIDNPESVIDIGCGPGNSTQVLRKRWPGTRIVGLDSSASMIEKAKKDYPDIEWITADASAFAFAKEYDIVFSNAALQWIPDHDLLLPRLFEAVSFRGALAVQVPADSSSPLREALLSVSSREKWSQFTSGAENLMTYHTVEYYYDILSAIGAEFDLWETVYYHVMRSHIELVEWYRSTGMRPFIERLHDEESRRAFEKEILSECRKSYPVRSDRKILYPFKRIFFIAYKSWRRCGPAAGSTKSKGTRT